MKVKIVEIHEEDHYYPDRDKLIGKVGHFRLSQHLSGLYSGCAEKFYLSGEFTGEDSRSRFFYAVRLMEVKEGGK
jgi:hypothetical protein